MHLRNFVLAVAAATLLLGGCDAGSALTLPATSSSADGNGSGYDEEDERRRRLVAWLQSDLDGDGLTNEIELEFGLDPQDPTDGPDIDGDGIPNYRDDDVDGDGIVNQTDPDIDGDGLFNFLDADIDGDAVPNAIDFDIDADGIRRRWDWDTDSDGARDNVDKDDDDDEVLREEELNKFKKLMRDAGFLAVSPQVDDPPLNRFAAHVEQNRRRAEQGDQSADEELKELARMIDGGDSRPIRIGSREAHLITLELERRFKKHELSADHFRLLMVRMDGLSGPENQEDDSDAVDAVVRQVIEIEDPRSIDADKELAARIDGIEVIQRLLPLTPLPAVSDGISRLAKLPGDETLEEKVGGVRDLAPAIEKPNLDNIVGGLERVMQAVAGLESETPFDEIIATFLNHSRIGEGIDEEMVEEVVETLTE